MQSANKLSKMGQSKSYIAPPRFNKKDDRLYWKSRLIRPCVKLIGSSQNCPFRSMCIREKNDDASCDIKASVHSISQYLQWTMLIVDSERA